MPIRMRITGEDEPDIVAEGAEGLIVAEAKTARVPSSIQFPYTDMSDAVAVAEGLLKGGGVPLSRDQMAAAMDLSPNGGGFATKVATARIFGVIESAAGKYQLTDTGFEIVDTARQANAKITAFMNVELFRKTYEDFRRKLLPPRPHGLERAFVSFGVSEKNVKVARLAFERSARLAGMFPNAAEDRLVIPFGVSSTNSEPIETAEQEAVKAAPAALAFRPLDPFASGPVPHPLIAGMMAELPEPKSDWSKVDQAIWLDTLAGLFRVVYKSSDKGQVAVSYIPQATPFD